ncbi:MAG: OmpH family outer membrane protein [Deltaproteobacteria bacterium]|jgi:Skp family chaperone for outer membrane proteins|nr:OmpH family outer membrane protein [Deltaproteobacteria bacterium]
MSKNFAWSVLGLTLLFSIVLFGCNEDKQKPLAGIVDAEAVFQKSTLAAAGMKHIDALNTEMQAKLAQMQSQLQAAPEDAELEGKLQSDLFALQTRMDQGQRQIAEKINAVFDQAVEECRVAQGLEVILPKQLVMASRPEADITEAVVAAMDKSTVDFSDIKLEESAPAAAPETPADAATETPDAAASAEEAAPATAPETPVDAPAEAAAPAETPAN